MQKITVVSAETKHSKDGTKTFCVVKDSAGGEFSSFDMTLATVKPGDVIECEIEVKGKYINIKDGFTIIPCAKQQIAVPDKPVSTRYGKSPEELASMERCNAITALANLWIAGKITETDPLVINLRDRLFYAIVGKEPHKAVTEKPKPIEATTQKDKVPQQATGAQIEGIPEFKTADEMLIFACDKVKMKSIGKTAYTYEEAKKKLGIEKPADITKIPAAVAVLFG